MTKQWPPAKIAGGHSLAYLLIAFAIMLDKIPIRN